MPGFKEIPILDLSEARSEGSKPVFLRKLRDALLNVGFLYIRNTGIRQELFDRVCDEDVRSFDLPDEEKQRIEMKNQPSFLGYSKVTSCLEQTSVQYADDTVVGKRDHSSEGRLARAIGSEHTAPLAEEYRSAVP